MSLMPDSTPLTPPLLAQQPSSWTRYLPLVLAVAIALIYSQTLQYPFVFDSVNGILHNKQIRTFPEWDSAPFSNRRLVVFITFFFNFCLTGISPVSYHLFNIFIHIVNAMLVYALVLMCLGLPDRKPLNPCRLPILTPDIRALAAFAIAGFWALHPVQVQSVTYTIQRSEAMAATGLLGCALAVLLHDRAKSFAPRFGFILLFAFFGAIGVYSKEVALVLPLFIYLFDSRVVTGSWLAPFKSRWPMYVLSLGLIALPLLSVKQNEMSTQTAKASAGFAQSYVTWYGYFLSQPRSILHYLWISVFPSSLSMDLGWYVMPPGPLMVLCFIPIVALFAWGIWMLFKRPWLGFIWIGVFFVVLAPSSSFMPIIDVAFEHRIYLPILAVAVTVISFLWLGISRLTATGAIPQDRFARSLVIAASAFMVVLGARSYVRTLDFESELTAWQSVTLASPENQRAWHATGVASMNAGQFNEALNYFAQAHILEPNDPEPIAWAAYAQAKLGERNLALQAYDLGIAATDKAPQSPPSARAYPVLGDAALLTGDLDRAQAAYVKAIDTNPRNVNAFTNLGIVLSRKGDKQAALEQFKKAHELAPDLFDQQINLAEAYQNAARTDEALKGYQNVLERFPTQPRPHVLLSKFYMTQEDLPRARQALQAGLAIAPNDPSLLSQVLVLATLSRDYKAVAAAQDRLLSLNPQNLRLVMDKAWLLATCPDPAVRNPQMAVQLAQAAVMATKSQNLEAIQTLAIAHASRGEFEAAVKILTELKRLATAAGATSLIPQIETRIAQFELKQPFIDTAPFAGTPYEALDARLNPPPASQPATTQPTTAPSP